jgi:hypothetical protein
MSCAITWSWRRYAGSRGGQPWKLDWCEQLGIFQSFFQPWLGCSPSDTSRCERPVVSSFETGAAAALIVASQASQSWKEAAGKDGSCKPCTSSLFVSMSQICWYMSARSKAIDLRGLERCLTRFRRRRKSNDDRLHDDLYNGSKRAGRSATLRPHIES